MTEKRQGRVAPQDADDRHPRAPRQQSRCLAGHVADDDIELCGAVEAGAPALELLQPK